MPLIGKLAAKFPAKPLNELVNRAASKETVLKQDGLALSFRIHMIYRLGSF